MSASAVHFARVGLSLPCPVPVVPGTPRTMDDDGEPIPLEQRTEACAVDAWWFIGGQPVCDIHLREACDLLGLDADSVLDEGGRAGDDGVPWEERHRYSQEMAQVEGLPWEAT